MVACEGRLPTRQWEDERKIRHWKTEIVANQVEMLSGRRKKDHAAEAAAEEPGLVDALARYRTDAAKAAERELAAYVRIQSRHAEAIRILSRWIGDAERADAARDWRARARPSRRGCTRCSPPR